MKGRDEPAGHEATLPRRGRSRRGDRTCPGISNHSLLWKGGEGDANSPLVSLEHGSEVSPRISAAHRCPGCLTWVCLSLLELCAEITQPFWEHWRQPAQEVSRAPRKSHQPCTCSSYTFFPWISKTGIKLLRFGAEVAGGRRYFSLHFEKKLKTPPRLPKATRKPKGALRVKTRELRSRVALSTTGLCSQLLLKTAGESL